MAITIRTPGRDDLEALIRRDEESFGVVRTDEDRARAREALDLDRFRIAVDRGDVVAVVGSHAKELTLPGGAVVPVGGTTWASVAPTHRRQGLLRRLMDEVHGDIAERGEPAAALLASEGSIYERFGYGVATRWRVIEVDRRRTRIDPQFVPEPGSVRLVDPIEHVDQLTEIFDRHCRSRVGEISRDRAWIDRGIRGLQPGVRCALHADGYAMWKITPDWGEGDPAHELRVFDFVAATPEAHLALWHLLLSHDLVGPIRCRTGVTPDDALPYLLTDQRALKTVTLNDMLWLCPLDPGALLSARSYRVDDEMVIEIAEAGERWRVGRDGAESTSAEPDLTMTQGALGALLLGGVSATELCGGRRLTGSAEAVQRADVLFGWTPLPHCSTAF